MVTTSVALCQAQLPSPSTQGFVVCCLFQKKDVIIIIMFQEALKNVQRTVTRTIKNNFMDGAKQAR